MIQTLIYPFLWSIIFSLLIQVSFVFICFSFLSFFASFLPFYFVLPLFAVSLHLHWLWDLKCILVRKKRLDLTHNLNLTTFCRAQSPSYNVQYIDQLNKRTEGYQFGNMHPKEDKCAIREVWCSSLSDTSVRGSVSNYYTRMDTVTLIDLVTFANNKIWQPDILSKCTSKEHKERGTGWMDNSWNQCQMAIVSNLNLFIRRALPTYYPTRNIWATDVYFKLQMHAISV